MGQSNERKTTTVPDFPLSSCSACGLALPTKVMASTFWPSPAREGASPATAGWANIRSANDDSNAKAVRHIRPFSVERMPREAARPPMQDLTRFQARVFQTPAQPRCRGSLSGLAQGRVDLYRKFL